MRISTKHRFWILAALLLVTVAGTSCQGYVSMSVPGPVWGSSIGVSVPIGSPY